MKSLEKSSMFIFYSYDALLFLGRLRATTDKSTVHLCKQSNVLPCPKEILLEDNKVCKCLYAIRPSALLKSQKHFEPFHYSPGQQNWFSPPAENMWSRSGCNLVWNYRHQPCAAFTEGCTQTPHTRGTVSHTLLDTESLLHFFAFLGSVNGLI